MFSETKVRIQKKGKKLLILSLLCRYDRSVLVSYVPSRTVMRLSKKYEFYVSEPVDE